MPELRDSDLMGPTRLRWLQEAEQLWADRHHAELADEVAHPKWLAVSLECLGLLKRRDDEVATLLADVAQLRTDFEGLHAEHEAALAEVAKLQAFKDWVHAYLDGKGVPKVVEDAHLAAGCRIGGRMDWVFAEVAKLRAANARLTEACRLVSLALPDLPAHCDYGETCPKCEAIVACRDALAALAAPPADQP